MTAALVRVLLPAPRKKALLFVLVGLAHHRRRVVHFNVTEHPTALWTAQQIVNAFPDDSAPSYLLRDRDQVYGQQFRHRVKGMQIEEVLTAPHSPWQARTHLALDKDTPDPRPIELPAAGRIVEVPEVGGLHHRYLRRAA